MFLEIDNVLLKYAVQFISYFIFSFTGALLKEMHYANTTKNRNYEFTAYKVVAGTLVGTFLSIAIQDYFEDSMISHWENMAFISFVLGLIGFELFTKLSSIAGIKSLVKEVKEVGGDIKETKGMVDEFQQMQKTISLNREQFGYHKTNCIIHDNRKKEDGG